MSPWQWYWRFEGDESYGEEFDSRIEALTASERETKPGDVIEIVEARASDAKKHEGSDFVPFLRTRNHERLTVSHSPRLTEERS